MIKSIKLLGQNISSGGACFYQQGTPSKKRDFMLTLFARNLWALTDLFHRRAANTLSTKIDRKCHKLVTRHTPLIEPFLSNCLKKLHQLQGTTSIFFIMMHLFCNNDIATDRKWRKMVAHHKLK